ncbi:peptidase [Streptomyces sulfonofaciens]|uniref:Peptidase n=1 Tax=Streptomyces sulfonofaciens TaxID=68272 RepID=A0A919GC01_9ACTN|nr:Clp protease N-terminal domain-containing protein [Streptomyces sulfonofaciens]GHH81803.1 peptidase [Streptomyces sulfonofaciens]
MFERFTKDARAVVSGAAAHAERAGEAVVDTDHLLLALLDREGSRASFALDALGARDRRDSIARGLATARRRGGLSGAEADALAGLGIDLSEIISRVEQTHGVGALAADSGGRRGRGRMRHRPFTNGAKKTLERSLRIATGHRDRHIGDEHLLLALLARPGTPAEVLAEHNVTYDRVDRVLYGEPERDAG